MRGYAVKLVGAAAIACMAAIAPHKADAVVMTSGCAGGDFGADCSLGELVAGGSIVINDHQFAGFTLSLFAGSALDASVIRVDPIDVLMNPGFALVDTGVTLRRTDGDFTQNDLSFTVAVLRGNLRIKDNTLDMAVGDVVGAGSFTQVFETVLDSTGAVFLGSKDTFCGEPACSFTTVSDSADFALVPAVSVSMGIDAVSGDIGGVGEINSITVQFSQQVPVPGTLGLLALGIAAFGVSRRRQPA